MLRRRKTMIIYVSRNELVILASKFVQAEKILIPEAVVNHMDVVGVISMMMAM